MGKLTIKTINSFLKEKKITNKEVTKYKGEYLVLHICKNGVPVPLFHHRLISEAFSYLKLIAIESAKHNQLKSNKRT